MIFLDPLFFLKFVLLFLIIFLKDIMGKQNYFY